MCHLSGQTNESLELRYDRETYELAKWGAATNNIQFGLSIGSVGPHEADKLKVATYLYNQSSSMIFGLWIVEIAEWVSFGNEVNNPKWRGNYENTPRQCHLRGAFSLQNLCRTRRSFGPKVSIRL